MRGHIIAFSLLAAAALIAVAGLSGGDFPAERSVQSELTVGTYINETSITRITTPSQNFTETYSDNYTVTSAGHETLNVSEKVWHRQSSVVEFNWTIKPDLPYMKSNLTVLPYVNSSLPFYSGFNFTLNKSKGLYSFNGSSYRDEKVVASNGFRSTGSYLWYSNQTVLFDSYSGIVFNLTFRDHLVFSKSNVSEFVNGTDSLNTTNISLGTAGGGGLSYLSIAEISSIVAAGVVIAAVSVLALRKRR